MAGNNNESIKKSLRAIISAGNIDAVDFLDCYVTNVYPQGDEDYGTIDVKTVKDNAELKNVSLSAISESSRGEIKFPTLLSEVTVAWVNGAIGYVVEYSHIDTHVVDVNESTTTGVTEYEAPTDDEDYDETDATGRKTSTEHLQGSISSSVIDKSGSSDKSNHVTRTADDRISYIEDVSTGESSTVTQTVKKVKIAVKSSSIEQTESETAVKAPLITLSNGGSTQNAVLGVALKTVMNAFIDQVASIITTTSMGPQPIVNSAAVTALKSQVDSILSSVNFIE